MRIIEDDWWNDLYLPPEELAEGYKKSLADPNSLTGKMSRYFTNGGDMEMEDDIQYYGIKVGRKTTYREGLFLEFGIGTVIDDATEYAINKAIRGGVLVAFEFNGILLKAHPGICGGVKREKSIKEAVDIIVKEYHDKIGGIGGIGVCY